jgi:hypothetical protein
MLEGGHKGNAYAIVTGDSHSVADSSSVQRDEDGVCGGGGRRSGEGEASGELHVGRWVTGRLVLVFTWMLPWYIR